MGRPQKLDERQKAEIGRRLVQGESTSALAREFGVGKATISRQFSERTETVQNLARSLASTERQIETLTVSEQASVRTLADQMKSISQSLLQTAAINGKTAAILAQRGADAASNLDDMSTLEDLRLTAAYVETANKAGSLGVSLIAANKGKDAPEVGTINVITGVTRG